MILVSRVPGVEAASNCVPTIVVCSLFVSLSWIALLLRLWTRLKIVKNLGWDDRLMVVAVVRSLLPYVLVLVANFLQVFFSVYCAAVINISTRVTATHNIVSYQDLLISINVR
jgi:hypothetical protein